MKRELGSNGLIRALLNRIPLVRHSLALRALNISLNTLNRYPDGSGHYLKKVLSERITEVSHTER